MSFWKAKAGEDNFRSSSMRLSAMNDEPPLDPACFLAGIIAWPSFMRTHSQAKSRTTDVPPTSRRPPLTKSILMASGPYFFPFLKSGQLREELFSLRGDHMPTLARGVRHQEALLVQPIPSFHHTSRDLGLTGPVFIPRRSRPYTLVLVLKHAEEVIAIQPPILRNLAFIPVEMYEEKFAEMRQVGRQRSSAVAKNEIKGRNVITV